ncbi:hypothetical protein GXM_01131 [Nostoc sphaeroides CCNUC1]|uniref:Uncharacterized protein n=1 Tax=Nostoc sphaeroides CCNUC1 TaxID=2653204 RepID=A0A5P8VT86_9NOSO|nr:hypothetical protein GXM_01131 [Nostoc sphaeroides CCNUC1]
MHIWDAPGSAGKLKEAIALSLSYKYYYLGKHCNRVHSKDFSPKKRTEVLTKNINTNILLSKQITHTSS